MGNVEIMWLRLMAQYRNVCPNHQREIRINET